MLGVLRASLLILRLRVMAGVFIGGGGGARFGVVSPLPASRGELVPFGLPTEPAERVLPYPSKES